MMMWMDDLGAGRRTRRVCLEATLEGRRGKARRLMKRYELHKLNLRFTDVEGNI